MNMDVIERDTIIFGGYDLEQYWGGIRQFDCTVETINELLEKGFIDAEECHNCSPSTADFIGIAETEGMEASLGGYAVSPERSDYRVTLTDITIEFDAKNTDLLVEMIGHLRYADEFDMSINDGVCRIYAWWD